MTSQPTRSALVCGSDDRLTEAIARRLSAERIAVAILATASSSTRSSETGAALPVFTWDVGDYAACEQGIRRVTACVGPLDVLVNAAQVAYECPLQELTQPMWRDVIKVNLGGCFNMAKAVFPSMCERCFGRIVTIAPAEETSGSIANRAAVLGLHGFTRALALEGAAAGVTANLIELGCRADREDTSSHVAHAVAFLCADASGRITGSTLTVGVGSLSRS